jgi:hypothetical protein
MYDFDENDLALMGIMEHLIDEVVLDPKKPALGIAKYVRDNGISTLSAKQMNVFTQYIEPHIDQKCPKCGEDMCYQDSLNVLEGLDGCSDCNYRQYVWDQAD